MINLLLSALLLTAPVTGAAMDAAIPLRVEAELLKRYGEAHRFRIERGVRQCAALWRETDGDAEQFQTFCLDHFIADADSLRLLFERMERNLEILWGHAHEVGRELKAPLELDQDSLPLLRVDYLFAEYDPFAHLQEDLFQKKIGFVVLLNFPIYSLEEKLALGPKWSRGEWARARLADAFDTRIPPEVAQELSRAYVQADDYIANYNIFMGRLLDPKGKRLFPPELKLISHWGLRDEIKSQYAAVDGLPKQQLIYAVMDRIIRQEIPKQVVNSDEYDWDPVNNRLFRNNQPVSPMPEGGARYEKLLTIFHAEQRLDQFSPLLPTKIDRRFKKDRELSEEQVEDMIREVLTSPTAKQVAGIIRRRLNRPLQPFDIWYDGFKPRSRLDATELDRIVKAKYPNVAAFQQGMSTILTGLGFDTETAAFLQSKITVDPARGAGHASGALRREDNAHLRTRIAPTGMTYKGYNIAVHELGHNVEQVFSLNRMDHYLLSGVPNTAFTEAFAFVFQSRDLQLLGVSQPAAADDRRLQVLDAFWSTCEIGGVGLVDMRLWHWLYDHP
ncbi:MAG: hypothetical protein ONB12_05780, partial [candidate division KSB1 bacterium]|nr:hypothetical protein [candidate division KSB1 bacterium]